MVAFSPEAQTHFDRYIGRIKAALRGQSSVDADEVERDVLGHIETELAGHSEPIGADLLLDVLDRLGTPDEWLPAGTASGPSPSISSTREDWWLASLTLAIFLAGPVLFVPMVLWPLPPLLVVVSVLCARLTLARAVEQGRSLGTRAWLVYPALVVWYGAFVVGFAGGPPLVIAVFASDDPAFPGRLAGWFGETASIGALAAISTLLGIWWMLLGLLLRRFPGGIQAAFRPFADWFERRHATRISVVGAALFAPSATILALLFMWS